MSDEELERRQEAWDEVINSDDFKQARQEWDEKRRKEIERLSTMGPPDCDKCKDSMELDNGNPCPDCCPHDEHDHGYCLSCGTNIMDDLIGRAELLEDR